MLLALCLLAACARPPWWPAPSQRPTASQPTSTSLAEWPATSPDRPDPRVPVVTPNGFVDGPPGRGMDRFLTQGIAWQPCGGDECATVSAPLDYLVPDGQAITLALRRKPATATPRLGTLFVNPGGPGQSGRDLVDRFRREGLEQYDIVGWDPRGTGASTPVECFQGKDLDAYTSIDMSPDDNAEMQALVVMYRSFGQSCLEHSGRLLQHVSTEETVRDLDLLRHLVGDEKLNYLGYSYGTHIGALYAQLFPAAVGRMVLDSPVNITTDESIQQPEGFDRALGNFAQWCVERKCDVGDTPQKVIDAVTTVFDRADVQPLKTDTDRKLSQADAVTGVAVTLYGDARSWAILLDALDAAHEGDGTQLLRLADFYNGRREDGTYDEGIFAFSAIRCLDRPDRGLAGAQAEQRLAESKAPVFGRYFGPDLQCPVWPVQPAPPAPDITGHGAAPIVVVGTTGDSATPYEFATWMVDKLESGVLVTREGDGHGAYGDSPCVNDLVVHYFAGGNVPADKTVCHS